MATDPTKTAYRLSIAWGITMLVLGCGASFSIGTNDGRASLVGFFLIFAFPIVASVVARWFPKVARLALLVAAVVLFVGFYRIGGVADVLQVIRRPYLWFHVLFGITFLVLPSRTDIEKPAADGIK
jgi:hypothetical protein